MMMMILMVIKILFLLLLLLVMLLTILLHLQVHLLIPIRELRIPIRDYRLPKHLYKGLQVILLIPLPMIPFKLCLLVLSYDELYTPIYNLSQPLLVCYIILFGYVLSYRIRYIIFNESIVYPIGIIQGITCQIM